MLECIPADGVDVRAVGRSRLPGRDGAYPAISTSAEITENWDKMDQFLNTMFAMACKWRHDKDVYGAAS